MVDRDQITLELSKALEATKPIATRAPRRSLLRRSYIYLHLALRAARRGHLNQCYMHVDRAIPGFSRCEMTVSGTLIGVHNGLTHMLQAA